MNDDQKKDRSPERTVSSEVPGHSPSQERRRVAVDRETAAAEGLPVLPPLPELDSEQGAPPPAPSFRPADLDGERGADRQARRPPTGPATPLNRPLVRDASAAKSERSVELRLPGGARIELSARLERRDGLLVLDVDRAPINPPALVEGLMKLAGRQAPTAPRAAVASSSAQPPAPKDTLKTTEEVATFDDSTEPYGQEKPPSRRPGGAAVGKTGSDLPPIPAATVVGSRQGEIQSLEDALRYRVTEPEQVLPRAVPTAPTRTPIPAAPAKRSGTGPAAPAVTAKGPPAPQRPPQRQASSPSSAAQVPLSEPIFSADRPSVVGQMSNAPRDKPVRKIPSIPVVVDDLADEPAEAPSSEKRSSSTHQAISAPGVVRSRASNAAPVVGIDFGTSTSSVAVMGAELELVPDEGGDYQLPSVVSFPMPGEVVVGAEARRRMGAEAQWTIASPKRLLGRPYKDPQVAQLTGPLAIRTFAGTDKLTRFEAHGEIYSVTDICAMILKNLRARACKYTGAEITKAVFTVPVGFGSLQRSALELAAKDAGLSGIILITEPSAALLAHGFRGQSGLAAVYDFGGGTFDFCIVEVSSSAFRVLCAGGDPWLGGDDFDNVLAAMVADRFYKDSGVELRNREVEWQALVLACEQAKRELSTSRSTVVRLDNLVHTSGGPRGLVHKVTRKEFVSAANDLIERSVTIGKHVMHQAGINPEQVDSVVMTGGTSLIPAISKAVTRLFGRKPIAKDSEFAVVRGAALRGAEISGESMSGTSTEGRTLQEVAGRAIGAATEGSAVVPLFERDTPLPAETKHTFTTVRDRQTELVLLLFESSKQRVDQREVLGQLRYRGLPAMAAGRAAVEFTFVLDDGGLLHVTANVGGKVFERTIRLK